MAWEHRVGADVRRISREADGFLPVLHLRLFHPANDYEGHSPLEAAALIGPTPSGGRGGRQSSSSSLSSSGLTPLPGLSSLTPPVPSVFPQVVSQVIPWVATDPAEGTDLRTLLLDGISPLALGRLLLPIADLLDRAAALSLCHGELSPREILLVDAATEGGLSPGSVREGRPMLLDLGLAKVVAENPLDIPMPPELLWYRSPEQCQSGLRVDAASDRYALAAILFEGVAGRPPFLAQSAPALLLAHRVAPVPPLRSLLAAALQPVQRLLLTPIDSYELLADRLRGAESAMRAEQQARQQGQQVTLSHEQFLSGAHNRVAAALLVGEVARQNDLKLDSARLKETMQLIASTYEDPSQVIELYRNDPNMMSQLQNRVMEEQVIDWIAERAQSTETSLSFTDAMRPAA